MSAQEKPLEILFELTPEHLETGLRGIPVGYCTTSYVDPQKGLSYIGIPVDKLAYNKPEEVIYLLYHGKQGNEKEVSQFFARIHDEMTCSKETIHHIESLPRIGSPMKLFSAALLILGMLEGKQHYRFDCLQVIAKLPHLVAACINHHAGWGATPEPRKDLSYVDNFVYMVNVPNGNKDELGKALQLFCNLHFDHGGGNLSTFVGKAVASSLEDMYGSLSAAMCALEGPRHGRANQDSLLFVQEVLKIVGENASEQEVENLIRRRLANNELVFGFGHAVLRVEDPRAAVQYEFVKQYYSSHPLVKIALLLRNAGSKVLKENPKVADPYPNVDAISGTMLTAAGFPYPEYFTVLFGMARCVGISIQIVYERLEARGGKGTPIVRPRYFYKSRV